MREPTSSNQVLDHIERGRGFARHGRWEDAINELKMAHSLEPKRADIVYDIALVYKDRYQEKVKSKDREEARKWARLTLSLSPNHEQAYALLNLLDQAPVASTSAWSSVALGAGLILVLGGIGAGLAFYGGSKGSSYTPPPLDLPKIDLPAFQLPAFSMPSITKGLEGVEIPVEFDPGKSTGLAFTNRGSVLNNYTSSSFFNLSGDLENQSKTELTEVKLQLQLLNAAGEVVGVTVFDAVSQFDAPLRPQDTRGFHELEETKPSVTKAKLTVQLFKSNPAPASYAPEKPVEVVWGFVQPSHIKLTVGERSSEFSKFDSAAYHESTLAFHNDGDATLSELKVQFSYYDKDDNLLSAEEAYVLPYQTPPLLPGQVRPFKTTHSVSRKFDHYRITILNAQ